MKETTKNETRESGGDHAENEVASLRAMLEQRKEAGKKSHPRVDNASPQAEGGTTGGRDESQTSDN